MWDELTQAILIDLGFLRETTPVQAEIKTYEECDEDPLAGERIASSSHFFDYKDLGQSASSQEVNQVKSVAASGT